MRHARHEPLQTVILLKEYDLTCRIIPMKKIFFSYATIAYPLVY